MSHPTELTDGTGTVWKRAASPPRNGQPLYYSTGKDNWALTRDEIRERYGLKKK